MNHEKIKVPYLFAGFAILVSLSLLDNIRGPLLPVVTERLNIDYGIAGYFLTTGCFASIAAVIGMGALLKRKSEKFVTLIICAICTIPGLIAPFIDGSVGLILLGLVMGSGISLMASICSILTILGSPTHLRGRALSIQQVMYGIGSFAAPLIFSGLIAAEFPWWVGITLVSSMNLLLFLIFLRILPSESSSDQDPSEESSHPFSVDLLLPIVLFAICVGGEVLTSMWMSTFLVKAAHFDISSASQYNSAFYLMIAGSRFCAFLFVPEKWERRAILLCLVSAIVCVSLSLTVDPRFMPGAGLVGPFFPLFMAQVSKIYPSTWRQMTIWIFASIQFVLGSIHLAVGNLTDFLGIRTAFVLSPLLLTIGLILIIVFFRKNSLVKTAMT